MDVILARAGLCGAEQRALCLGAVKDEVAQTEAKLKDALASLKRLRDIVRVARDVHKSSTPLAILAPHTEASVAQMTKMGRQIAPLVDKIYSGLRSPSTSPLHESSTEEDEEGEERLVTLDWTVAQQRLPIGAPSITPHTSSGPIVPLPGRAPPVHWGNPTQRRGDVLIAPADSARLSAYSSSGNGTRRFGARVYVGQKRGANTSPPRSVGNSFLRPSAPEQLSALSDVRPIKCDLFDVPPPKNEGRRDTKRVAVNSNSAGITKEVHVVADLKRRLAQISKEDNEGALFRSLKAALDLARLTVVTGEDVRVQQAVNLAREAIEELLKRDVGFTIERNRHVEDVLQMLSVVVRAVLVTKGKLEASIVRALHELIKQVQNKFEESSTRFQWCNTNMRKFITSYYKKLPSVSVEDQNKLVAALDEVRGWKCSEDYSVSRFEGIMAVVRELLDGCYEEWQPCEDSRLAELLGLMNIRMGTFRDSTVQRTRQQEVKGWLNKMSGVSFTPTLDLVSVPPPKAADVCTTSSGGFQLSGDVEASLKRIEQASRMPSLGYFTRTLYSFMSSAVMTRDQEILPLHRLCEFNEHLQAINSFDCELDHCEILRSSQEFEKILYFMRVIMSERPDYEKCSTSAVEALLAFFPAAKRPNFEFPSSATTPEPQTEACINSVDDSNKAKD